MWIKYWPQALLAVLLAAAMVSPTRFQATLAGSER